MYLLGQIWKLSNTWLGYINKQLERIKRDAYVAHMHTDSVVSYSTALGAVVTDKSSVDAAQLSRIRTAELDRINDMVDAWCAFRKTFPPDVPEWRRIGLWCLNLSPMLSTAYTAAPDWMKAAVVNTPEWMSTAVFKFTNCSLQGLS